MSIMPNGETFELAGDDDLPERWRDPRIDKLWCACSNGWEGSYSIGSALDHKPHNYPQCFPDGPDAESTCTVVVLVRSHGQEPDAEPLAKAR